MSAKLLTSIGLVAASFLTSESARAQSAPGLFANRFSLDPLSPELLPPAPAGQSGAHAFVAACNGGLVCLPPVPYLTPPMLGLLVPDNIDSFSPGVAVATTFPPPAGNDLIIHFSITPASAGANPVITAEVAGDGAASDVFQLAFDGVGGGPVLNRFRNGFAPPWVLALGIQVDSDVDGWAWVAPMGNPQAYFTLDAPTALANGVSPSDVFWQNMGGPFAAEGALGLLPGDEIDALSVQQDGNPAAWEPGEVIYFSLRPLSPMLGILGASPADILAVVPGGIPFVWAPAGALGLLPTDDINALQIYDPGAWHEASVPSISSMGVVLSALLLLFGALFVLARRR